VRRCEPANGKRPYGGSTEMANLLKRLWTEEDGQGLVEYTLVVLLVALVFWLGVRDSGVGDSLANGWSKVIDCVTTPSTCSA
jgi:Flp pilus assembly pilin Flp